MQQAGSDHLVAAKLPRNVLKEGITVGRCYRLGGLHQVVEFVRGQSQSQLVQWGHGKRSTSKNQECGNRILVSGSERFSVKRENAMSKKLDAAIDALVDALAELPEHELEFWQCGNRLGVLVLYELNRRYPVLAQATAPVRRKSA